jgi:hypothetical protein
MPALEKTTIAPGLTFDTLVAGEPGAPGAPLVAAASLGRWPIVFPSGWRRSPCCRGRIPTRSIGRCKCKMAIRRSGRGE